MATLVIQGGKVAAGSILGAASAYLSASFGASLPKLLNVPLDPWLPSIITSCGSAAALSHLLLEYSLSLALPARVVSTAVPIFLLILNSNPHPPLDSRFDRFLRRTATTSLLAATVSSVASSLWPATRALTALAPIIFFNNELHQFFPQV